MAHSNYAKDRDLMQEAYGSVQGNIPHTQSTAPARLFNEAHCDEETGEDTVTVELELDKDNAEKLHAALMDEVAPAEDSSCTSNEEEHAAEDGEHEDAEKVDYGPSGEGTPVHPDEANETAMHERLEGLYNTDLMKTFINTYHELAKDIKNEEPFETEDILKFLTKKMNEFKPAEDSSCAAR